MKTIQTIIATSILLASVNASAGSIVQRTETETLTTTAAATKAQAYQRGIEKLSQLTSSSGKQLDQKLRVHSGYIDINTLKVNDGGFVTIQERMSSSGNLEYIGVVNVKFSYTDRDIEN